MPGRWKHWALLLPPVLRAIVRAAVASVLLIGLLQPASTPALAGPAEQIGCSFQRGFRSLVVEIPRIVGQCLENERFNPDNGNAEQRSTGGLLVWRKADNWTAFTDGSTTCINGPYGLQSRPNNQTFAWEPPAAPAPPPVWSAPSPPDWAVTLPPAFAPA